jgi:mannosyltransferase OCH1-like enzyme
VLLFVLVSRIQVFPPPQRQAVVLKRHDPQRLRAGPDESDRVEGFPKKIWQSWKTDPLNFEQRNFDTARTWTSINPGYRYEVLTDHNALLYVEEKFGPQGFNRPDIVELYRTVNATIVKADLLRYMIMYAEGGVYADIDVEALKPVDRFIPARYSPADVDMVIGVEIDQPEFRDHPILGQKCMSFCQWTFMCRPRLPVMLQLIENIKTWLSEIASQQQVSISDVALDFDAIISGTGPSAFTAAVLAEMNKDRPSQEEITWSHFHELDESRIVNRVLVLDVEKFAAGQGHSNSGNHGSRSALVKHRMSGPYYLHLLSSGCSRTITTLNYQLTKLHPLPHST